MSTIDNIHASIIKKLSLLKNLYNAVADNDTPDKYRIKQQGEQITELMNYYDISSIEILNNYYKLPTNGDIYQQYIKFINNENIINKMKKIYNYFVALQKKFGIEDDQYLEWLNSYDTQQININSSDKPIYRCLCGENYRVEPKYSELLCKKCGNSEKIYGVIFEDDQFYYQEGQRAKCGKYDSTKHCKFWIDRIQAKESTEIPEKIIQKIKNRLFRDKIYVENITCKTIREYLKEIKQTIYNNHIPLIKKILTGKEPPQFSDYELKLIYVYFGRVVQIYNKTKPDNKPNCPYHPFFIYKIIEQILNKPTDGDRRNEILSYIHLQSRDTLIGNDIIWQPICEQIPEFIYSPTEYS